MVILFQFSLEIYQSFLVLQIFSVSEKVHTTRSRAFAVINQDNKQIVSLIYKQKFFFFPYSNPSYSK